MDVFYHVTFIEKRKKCKIDFCYIRDQNSFVLGDISVDRGAQGTLISFSNNSKDILKESEKKFILNRVLKNLYLSI